MLDVAERAFRQRGVPVWCARADIEALPYGDNRFDLTMAGHVLEHFVDRGERQATHRVTEVLVDGRLCKGTFRPQVPDLQGFLLREACRHDLAKQPHHFLVCQRPLVALDHGAQHLRLPLGPEERG